MLHLDYDTTLVVTCFVSALLSLGGLLIAPALREAIPSVNRIVAANITFFVALLLRIAFRDDYLQIYEPLYLSLWLASFLAVASALRHSAGLPGSDRDLIALTVIGSILMFIAAAVSGTTNPVRVISSFTLIIASGLSMRIVLNIDQPNLQRPKYCLLIAFSICMLGSLGHLPSRLHKLFTGNTDIYHTAYTYVLVIGFLMASNIGIMLTLYIRLLNRTIGLARKDELTGLLNRRGLNETLSDYVTTQGSALVGSVITIDIDHFKRVNDTYGHASGDKALQWFSNNLKSFLRKGDILVRLGGEEFGVILPDVPVEEATGLAQRICDSFSEQIRMNLDGEEVRITGSFGVAPADCRDKDITASLERADVAMYAAKNGGRNQVRVWSEPDAVTP